MPSVRYQIRCDACGEYWADKAEFDRFLNDEVRALLASRPGESAYGLDFSPCCPRCQRDGRSEVRLSVLRPRRSAPSR